VIATWSGLFSHQRMSALTVCDTRGPVFFVRTPTAFSLRMTVAFPRLLAARFRDVRRSFWLDLVV